MPKTAVETPICDICGADVRDGSEFCYNCGGSLRNVVEEEAEPEPIVPVPTEPKKNGTAPKERRGARRRRAVNREPVEVVWQPKEGVSGLYIAAALFFFVVAAALFFVAMWMK